MRIGINGREPAVGQAFANLDLTLGEPEYVPGSGQELSTLGTVIGLEEGPGVDEFFLTFEELGSGVNVRSEGSLPSQPTPEDLDSVSTVGLKTFEEINASMSKMTGIPTTQSAVATTYSTVKQQLPTVPDIKGFLASHQMGITQMAIQYCDALVEDGTKRTAFFNGFDFNANVADAFDAAGRSQVTDALLANFIGTGLDTQPTNAEIEIELNGLIDTLAVCSGDCSDPVERTRTVVKASCAAVLGSAVTLIQ